MYLKQSKDTKGTWLACQQYLKDGLGKKSWKTVGVGKLELLENERVESKRNSNLPLREGDGIQQRDKNKVLAL